MNHNTLATLVQSAQMLRDTRKAHHAAMVQAKDDIYATFGQDNPIMADLACRGLDSLVRSRVERGTK